MEVFTNIEKKLKKFIENKNFYPTLFFDKIDYGVIDVIPKGSNLTFIFYFKNYNRCLNFLG